MTYQYIYRIFKLYQLFKTRKFNLDAISAGYNIYAASVENSRKHYGF